MIDQYAAADQVLVALASARGCWSAWMEVWRFSTTL